MRLKRLIPFYAPDGGQGGAGAGDGGSQQQVGSQQQAQTPSIDYEKIAQIVAGKQAATEESVLKGYFKQQGLTKEQMDQAIASFKQQQAASQPDVSAMQTQLTQAQAAAQQAQIQSAAVMAAVSLGIDANTIPYILKMADLSQAMGQDGKINDETVKAALNKVLEDVPALKPQASGSTGFVQVGAASGSQQQTANEDALKKAFGL
jgi:hypothetical protein